MIFVYLEVLRDERASSDFLEEVASRPNEHSFKKALKAVEFG
jgi:hypothetical protein